jgi:O-succinylbenzoic acid--CoA ligase
LIVLDFQKGVKTNIDQLEGRSEAWIIDILDFLKVWNSDSENFTSSTSGSTGVPKIIKIKKKYAINSARLSIDFFNLQPSQNALLCMSPRFIGSKMMIIRAIIAKMKLYCVEASSNPSKDLKGSLKIDFAPMIAMQALEVINNSHSIEFNKILIGGSAVSDSFVDKISNSKIEFYSSYGMTETLSHIAIRKINGSNSSKFYALLPRIEINLNSDSRLSITSNDLGIQDLLTNDCALIHQNNEFEIIGRFDNVVNSGGVKLHLEVIEKKISQINSAEFILTKSPDEKLGERLVMLTVSKMEFDFSNLSKYEIPKEVIHVREILKNENGKALRDLKLYDL